MSAVGAKLRTERRVAIACSSETEPEARGDGRATGGSLTRVGLASATEQETNKAGTMTKRVRAFMGVGVARSGPPSPGRRAELVGDRTHITGSRKR